ncbi:hypothetical protein EHP00_1825 [Ecytonucleospora hepatopenaei]|uniref:Uncharacterized protein n=1 Tax=Ecytonucleospora hepatopenaei TaxID=646526 RepID=A0A1W0E5F1_9MICR|nr:hypothetical protein EHP00_1825 [Ecytonucleospora hepatopenaei]
MLNNLIIWILSVVSQILSLNKSIKCDKNNPNITKCAIVDIDFRKNIPRFYGKDSIDFINLKTNKTFLCKKCYQNIIKAFLTQNISVIGLSIAVNIKKYKEKTEKLNLIPLINNRMFCDKTLSKTCLPYVLNSHGLNTLQVTKNKDKVKNNQIVLILKWIHKNNVRITDLKKPENVFFCELTEFFNTKNIKNISLLLRKEATLYMPTIDDFVQNSFAFFIQIYKYGIVQWEDFSLTEINRQYFKFFNNKTFYRKMVKNMVKNYKKMTENMHELHIFYKIKEQKINLADISEENVLNNLIAVFDIKLKKEEDMEINTDFLDFTAEEGVLLDLFKEEEEKQKKEEKNKQLTDDTKKEVKKNLLKSRERMFIITFSIFISVSGLMCLFLILNYYLRKR